MYVNNSQYLTYKTKYKRHVYDGMYAVLFQIMVSHRLVCT